ncbi:hypothetical protein AND_001600 [Anopheles darlingi]|uniref:Endoplasmic reticulum vesicle transporter C-terminal domain-containing protein n=1 Tax=Anopheles darlingi TaxID=43151 RepID=W5JUG8_ANODA|nr:hypothetical protein AND_001600 [Anopheles darlingi]
MPIVNGLCHGDIIDHNDACLTESALGCHIDKGLQGVAGIYFKYDMSALRVIVRQDRDSIAQFIVRLSSIIAGIVVISGLLSKVAHLLMDLCCSTNSSTKLAKPGAIEPSEKFVKGSIIVS